MKQADYLADLLRIDAEVGPPARTCANRIAEAARAFLTQCLADGMSIREAGELLEVILAEARKATSEAVMRWTLDTP